LTPGLTPKAKTPLLTGFCVEPIGVGSNFDPEDLVKIFDFLEIVEPDIDSQERP